MMMKKINEAKQGKPQFVSTVGELKEILNDFDDELMLIGNTTDGKGNWFNYPVFVFKVQGNNNMFYVYLDEYKNAKE
ncbi:MAG: hypothetical protein ACOCVF_02730 [bacterium]